MLEFTEWPLYVQFLDTLSVKVKCLSMFLEKRAVIYCVLEWYAQFLAKLSIELKCLFMFLEKKMKMTLTQLSVQRVRMVGVWQIIRLAQTLFRKVRHISKGDLFKKFVSFS